MLHGAAMIMTLCHLTSPLRSPSWSLSLSLSLYLQVLILPMRPVGWMNTARCRRPSSTGTTPARARRSTYCSPSPFLSPSLLTSSLNLLLSLSLTLYTVYTHTHTHTHTHFYTMRHNRQPSENDCIHTLHIANPSHFISLHIFPAYTHTHTHNQRQTENKRAYRPTKRLCHTYIYIYKSEKLGEKQRAGENEANVDKNEMMP